MALVWHSAQTLAAGIDRLLRSNASTALADNGHDSAHPWASISMPVSADSQPSSLEDLSAGDGVRWSNFFPFVTDQTSPLIAAILTECRSTFPGLWPATNWPSQFNDFLENFGAVPIDALFTGSS